MHFLLKTGENRCFPGQFSKVQVLRLVRELTTKQKKEQLFLRYVFIERKSYDEVAVLLHLPRNEFKSW